MQPSWRNIGLGGERQREEKQSAWSAGKRKAMAWRKWKKEDERERQGVSRSRCKVRRGGENGSLYAMFFPLPVHVISLFSLC